jgi:hypothetical protein
MTYLCIIYVVLVNWLGPLKRYRALFLQTIVHSYSVFSYNTIELNPRKLETFSFSPRLQDSIFSGSKFVVLQLLASRQLIEQIA